jgi:two-component system, LytTR family, response regulator
MKAVIIDDEEDSRNILAGYLTRYCSDIEVCGFGESVATGKEAIAKYHPDIVFLDIEMPYGNGFDLLDSIEKITFETIFVTAFDHYAIQALNQSASYYLLKPISIDELIKAVDKVRAERVSVQSATHTHVLLENRRATVNQKIMLPTMEALRL